MKTTVRRKPNKNQQEKQTKKETPSMKRQYFKNERKLDLRRGCEEICFKERSTNKERKGATKIEQKTQPECHLKRG